MSSDGSPDTADADLATPETSTDDRQWGELFEQARAGDRTALGVILDHCSSHLLLIIEKLMGPALRRTIEPSDVMQETLLTAAQRFDVFEGKTRREFVGWLATLARRKLIDLARHNGRLKRGLKRHRSLDQTLESGGSMIAPIDTLTASQVAMRRELTGQMAMAFAKLEPREAEALRLRYVEGMSLDLVGRRLGTGRHGASGLVARSLRSLRQLLPEY